MRATSDLQQTRNVQERPSFDEIYMNFAHDLARRSTCRRLAVGCVIVSTDHLYPLGLGYNGNAHGLPNDCDLVGDQAVGSCGDIHAEANAIIKCKAPREQPKLVYCTVQPCAACAKLLIQLGGVQEVIFDKPYRIPVSIELLNQVGIKTRQFSSKQSPK